ncbi:WIAG-tail domain [Chengkuizengella sp. SCS-71B]|uniref:WIAG-tail domain n=1 Tax=Chengkuizengella sp. SCS-71B TaxID=3115290 RepID=UPI0032C226EA
MKKRRNRNKKMKKIDPSINELVWLDEEKIDSFRENIPIHDLNWFPDFQFLNQNPQKSSKKKKKVKKNKPLIYANPFDFNFGYNNFADEEPTITYRDKTDSKVHEKQNEQLKTIHQYNNSEFKMNIEEKSTEVFIFFDTPFKNTDYVLVAMTDCSNCYAALNEKTAEYAVIDVVLIESNNEEREEEQHGVLSWIAIGES